MPTDAKNRILQAATLEFAKYGYGGARLSRIASKSKANKQLTYYYFGSKKGLYEEVLKVAYQEVLAAERNVPPKLEDDLLYWLDFHQRHPYLLQLLEWQGRERRGRPPAKDGSPERLWQASLARIERNREGAAVPKSFQGAHTLITYLALLTWPLVFPEICRQIAGIDPSSPRFIADRRRFVAEFVRALTLHLVP